MLIIKSIIMLALVPELLGITVCGILRLQERPFCRYISGFICMVAMAYVIYLPLGLTGRSFHRYVQLLSIGYALAMVLGVFFWKKSLHQIRADIAAAIAWCKKHPGILLFAAILLVEILRVIFFTQANYSDDDTYISLVGDILESDTFFRRNFVDGRNLSHLYALDRKYSLTGWFAFQAYLCRVVGVHPLILIKTILPIAIILLHYMLIVDFVGLISQRRGEVLSYFLPLYAMLLEFGWATFSTSLSYYFVTWVWYGKSFLEFIILPSLLNQYLRMQWKRPADWLYAMLLIVAGLGVSTMGFVLIPVMCGMFVFTQLVRYIVRKRRRTC